MDVATTSVDGRTPVVLRRFAGPATVTALLLVAAANYSAAQMTAKRVRLSIPAANVTYLPFYAAKDKGYYTAEGIDLTINEGRGSANTVQVVAAGSDTFGLADSSSVILTASNDRGTRLRGIAAGADDYLSKPFDPKELLVRTKVLLRQRALRAHLPSIRQ